MDKADTTTQKQVERLLAMPAIQATLKEERAAQAAERKSVRAELAKLSAAHACTLRGLCAERDRRERTMQEADRALTAAVHSWNEARSEVALAESAFDVMRGRLERRLGELDNFAVLEFLRTCRFEKQQANGFRTYRDAVERVGFGEKRTVYETTSRQVVEHLARLDAAIPEAEALLGSDDLSHEEIEQRIAELAKRARINNVAEWRPLS